MYSKLFRITVPVVRSRASEQAKSCNDYRPGSSGSEHIWSWGRSCFMG